MVNVIFDVIVIFMDGCIFDGNEVFVNFFGYCIEELEMWGFYEFVCFDGGGDLERYLVKVEK